MAEANKALLILDGKFMSKYTLDKYRNIGIMATSMPAKQLRLKEFCIILEKS